MYVPDVRGRAEEGAEKYGYRLEDLERAEEKARHVRAVGGKSRRWLRTILIFIAVLTVLFVFFMYIVPSDPFLSNQ